MKAGIINVSAACVLELDDEEVSVLNHYLSYGFDHISAVSKMYPKEQTEKVFQALKDATDRIMSATGDARNLIFDERYHNRRKKRIIVTERGERS